MVMVPLTHTAPAVLVPLVQALFWSTAPFSRVRAAPLATLTMYWTSPAAVTYFLPPSTTRSSKVTFAPLVRLKSTPVKGVIASGCSAPAPSGFSGPSAGLP